MIFSTKLPDAPQLSKRINERGLESGVDKSSGFLWVAVGPGEFDGAKELLADVMKQAVTQFES